MNPIDEPNLDRAGRGALPEQSFSTQFSFALERARERPAAAATVISAAARIAGTYTVAYNAASGLLMLSGTLRVDGATYFVDDQLMIDQAVSDDAYFSAGAANALQLTAWSVAGMPEHGGALKLLAALAVMAHLGLRPHG